MSRPYFDAAKLAELEAMLDTETGIVYKSILNLRLIFKKVVVYIISYNDFESWKENEVAGSVVFSQ